MARKTSLRKVGSCVIVEAPSVSSNTSTPTGDEESGAHAVRKIFTEWDRDGNGSISKEELSDVMRGILGDMSESDVGRLMDEADSDGNGMINLQEFLEWMMKPAYQSQGKAIFTHADAFKPIFDVFDRDRTGTITKAEFTECHCLLQGALRLNPEKPGETNDDPLDLKMSEHEAFALVDKNNSGDITFPEFIQWMQDHIPESVSTEEIRTCCSKLATSLGSVFKAVQMAETGQLGEEDSEVLEKLLESLAASTRSFEDIMSRAPKTGPGWTEPPTGMSVERLKTAHMKYVPLHLGRVQECKFEVLCVPMGDESADPESRIWLGEVVRKVVYKSGKVSVESPMYYAYKRDDFSWKPVMASRSSAIAPGGSLFEEALHALTPEIRLFCLLKTEANFGVELKWELILRAFESAVDLELISRGQGQEYVRWVEKQVRDLLREKNPRIDDKHVQEFLLTKLKLRPRAVMGHLTALGFIQPSPVWEGFVKSSIH